MVGAAFGASQDCSVVSDGVAWSKQRKLGSQERKAKLGRAHDRDIQALMV